MISSISDGTTTILATSSYSVSSVVSAMMPINMIMLRTPSSRGFRTCVIYLADERSFIRIASGMVVLAT